MQDKQGLVLIPAEELRFRFVPNQQIHATLTMHNPTPDPIAYKIKTTRPQRYNVTPNTGVLVSWQTQQICFSMLAQEDTPNDINNCKDKFQIKSVVASHGETVTVPEMFGKDKPGVMDTIIKAFLEVDESLGDDAMDEFGKYFYDEDEEAEAEVISHDNNDEDQQESEVEVIENVGKRKRAAKEKTQTMQSTTKFVWSQVKNGKIGCAWCHEAGKNNIYARFEGKSFRVERLKEHENTKEHQQVSKHLQSGGKPQDLKPKKNMLITESFKLGENLRDEKTINQFKLVHHILKKGAAIQQYQIDSKFIRNELGFTKLSSSRETDFSAWEFAEVIDECLVCQLQQEVQKSQYIGICIDESQDISCKEQAQVCVTYLKDTQPITNFVELADCSQNQTAGALELIVDNVLSLLNVQNPEQKLVAYGSDGANVVHGSKEGLQGRLKRKFPFVQSWHCAAHRTNLVAKKSLDSIVLKNVEKVIQRTYTYFKYSPKRVVALTFLQEANNIKNLKQLKSQQIRWTSFAEALTRFIRNLGSVLDVLGVDRMEESIRLYEELLCPQILLACMMWDSILNITKKMLKILQKEEISFYQLRELLEDTKYNLQEQLHQLKNGGLEYVIQLIPDGYSLDLVHARGRQVYAIKTNINDVHLLLQDGNYVDLKSLQHVYKKIFKDMSDVINLQIEYFETMFPDDDLLIALSITKVQFWEKLSLRNDDQQKRLLKSSLQAIKKLFCIQESGEELLNFDQMKQQFVSYKAAMEKFQKAQYSEQGAFVALQCMDNISEFLKLHRIALVQPITTVQLERNFSSMNFLKNKLRSRLTNKHLNVCLRGFLLNFENFDYNNVYKKWSEGKQRKKYEVSPSKRVNKRSKIFENNELADFFD